MWTSCPKINYKLWCKLDKCLKNNRVTKRIDINRQYCDYLFTLSKYKKSTILSKPQQKISQLVQNTHEDTQYWKKNTTA